MITGRLRPDVYTPAEGHNAGIEQRRLRVVVDEVAVSLRHTTARPVRTHRAGAVGPNWWRSPIKAHIEQLHATRSTD